MKNEVFQLDKSIIEEVFDIWIEKLNNGLIDPDDSEGMTDLFIKCLNELPK